MIPDWLKWAREIQAIGQTGVHYAQNEFDRQRYDRLIELAAEIMSASSTLSYERVFEALQLPRGYATPRVDVRGAVFRDGKILMVRERQDGGWTLPGGWADVGDIPSYAAEREVLEESGFRVKATQLIGLYDANRTGPLELFHAFKLVFLCELIDGEAQPSCETSEVEFFDLDAVPELLSGERTLPRHMKDAFETYQNPGKPTIFD